MAMAKRLPLKALARDAVSVAILDSIRQAELVIDPRLIASYTASSASYYLFGEQLLLPFMKDITLPPELKMAVGKIAWNTPVLLMVARVFGGKISITNSLMTSAGSEFVNIGIEKATDFTPSIQ